MMDYVKKRWRVYDGNVVKVDKVDLDFGNGNTPTFEVIGFDTITGVAALPIKDQTLLLIEHYLAGIDRMSFVLPGGGLYPGELPEERMQAELAEETGMRAGKLTLLTRFASMPGYMGGEPTYLYVATALYPHPEKGDEPFPIRVCPFTLTEALSMIREGKIIDGRTMLAILYYAQMVQFPHYGRTDSTI